MPVERNQLRWQNSSYCHGTWAKPKHCNSGFSTFKLSTNQLGCTTNQSVRVSSTILQQWILKVDRVPCIKMNKLYRQSQPGFLATPKTDLVSKVPIGPVSGSWNSHDFVKDSVRSKLQITSNIFCTCTCSMQIYYTSWWFSTCLNNISQIGSSP